MKTPKFSKTYAELLLTMTFLVFIPFTAALCATYIEKSFFNILILYIITLVIVIIPFLLLLYFKYISPMKELYRGTSEIIDGNLDYTFTASGKNDLSTLANNLNLMLKTIKQQQNTLEELTLTDHLTGLANRRRLDSQLEFEVERYKRYHTPLSILVCDVDDFKSVNDTYGHLLGDTVLAEMASSFITNLRKTDLPARFGGEEFVILLPDTSMAKAKLVADKLRNEVKALRFATKNNDLIGITLTIGISSTEQFDEFTKENLPTMDDAKYFLLEQADKALYRGKSAGKNQISI